MSRNFEETIRALGEDGHRGWITGTVVALVLGALWAAWLFGSELAVYVATSEARLQVAGAARPVEATAEGKVVSSHMELGARVAEGEPLLVLDASEVSFELEEVTAQTAASRRALDEVRALVAAEEAVVAQMGPVASKAADEARARAEQAETTAEYEEAKARRLGALKSEGAMAALDILSVETEAKKQRALARAASLALDRLQAENALEKSERQLRLTELRQQVARLEGEISEGESRCKRLEVEIAKRTIRAPHVGRLADVTDTPPGSVVRVGQRVASVVPDGELEVVAEFPAYEAVGRIEPGQAARLRLTAFPWAQYGTLNGVVRRVASEAHDGRVRVEIALETRAPPLIPVQHGLVGAVEVAIEHASPATLLLRAAGRVVRPRDDPPAGVDRPSPLLSSATSSSGER